MDVWPNRALRNQAAKCVFSCFDIGTHDSHQGGSVQRDLSLATGLSMEFTRNLIGNLDVLSRRLF